MVYADIDPTVVSVANDLLADQANVGVVHGDLRRPASIFEHPEVLDRLDFAEPVAVLLTGVLPHLADTDIPSGILAEIHDVVVGGSYVAVSHLVPVPGMQREQERLQRLYDHTPFPLHYRTPRQISRLLTRWWTLIEPGIVPVTEWRPNHDPGKDQRLPTQLGLVGAVARAR